MLGEDFRMIRELIIEGFKRFGFQHLELKALTVLAGRNGAGKTSAIHALLLAHNAMHRRDGVAELNGPYGIELGWFEDVVNWNRPEIDFSITIRDEHTQEAIWTFSKGNTELYASVKGSDSNSELESLIVHNPRSFQYLAAERDGPRITQKASALPLELLEVGSRGEFAAQVLEKLGSSVVDDGRLSTNKDAPPLVKAQTEQWLSRIARPIEIDTATFPGTDIASLTFRVPGGSWVRPTNMGFGVSYSLPIVVAALTASSGGLLIVENPEAHLHPAGQSEMGVFLARMAAAGIQVIIETHSDHVLNGIRRAIGESSVLPVDNAIVHFFPDADASVLSLGFTATGGLSEWPPGFLDQYQLDIARISKVRRPR
jgi:predicted ATPase